MPPLLVEFLTALLRHALAGAAGYFVAKGILTQTQSDTMTLALVVWAIAFGWSLWNKYKSRIKFLTALEAAPGTTEQQVVNKISNGAGATLAVLLAVVLLGGMTTACAEHYTTPVAAVAGTADKVEQSGLIILHAAQTANATVVNGRPLISTAQLDQVAIACDKLGRLGTNLSKFLTDYNAAKASGGNTTYLAASIQTLINDATQTLAGVGKAVPSGTVQQIDQAVATAAGLYAQIRAAAL